MVNDHTPPQQTVGLYETLYVYQDFVDEVVEDLRRKSLAVTAGLDDFTPAERLAFYVMKENGYI